MCFFNQRATEIAPKKLTVLEIEFPKQEKQLIEAEKRRIVQTSPGEKVNRAKSDSFLGWQNQIVELEKVSKRKTQSTSSAQQLATQIEHPAQKPTQLSKFGISFFKKPSQSRPDEPRWAEQGTIAQDYVQGKLESDRTALNTREYLFYGYFQRIRSRLDQAWVPLLREKLSKYYRSGRHLASDMEHTSKVIVFLNEQGEIVRVKLVSESGTHDLDDAAVAAFNRAGPFPNPPKGMIDVNHEIQIPWNFILRT